MKSVTGWGTGGTNESGFSALPGGYRAHHGAFYYAGNSGYWWTSSMVYTGTNWIRNLNYDNELIIGNNSAQEEGYSCRCIKNDCIAPPVEANGGVDQTNLAFLSTTLGANTPTDGIGIWSIESGTGGVLLNADSANSTFGGTVGSTYVLRWTVTNNCGSIYDEVTVSFEEDASHLNPNLTYGSVSDIDGNSYATIQIGTQNWMAENLKVSKYNDGNTIPYVTDRTEWNSTLTGAFTYFNNDDSHNTLYGKFYNWHAVNTEKLCPTGWHIPTHAEWTILTDYLGGTTLAGGKMKSVTGWNSPNTGASNVSGFSGLPAGYRHSRSSGSLNISGFWWSASEESASKSYQRDLQYQNSNVGTGSHPRYNGLSCRCVED